MDYRLNQRRVSFSDPHSRQPDDEHVTAVAAAAFSIHSLEEALNLQKMKVSAKFSRPKTERGREGKISRSPIMGEISRERSSGQALARTRESRFPVKRPSGVFTPTPRPIIPAAGCQNHKRNSIIQDKNDKATIWEKTKIERIQKRYQKIKSKILAWESERKILAKMQMERKKSQWELKRAMEMQHYKNKIARIDMIAQGAITQLEDHKRKEESKAKEKAKKIRKTGRVPVKFFCFKSL
ncbi:hypothetical protein VNO78_02805 [Psophocarpus tetragonolobus]|uniref:Remorin C-terminal domain-containing protein n=1 Tax=Psophocarpus tetragonolobus TaxID=3891 RepID=A0AAN9SZA6_PSOTE